MFEVELTKHQNPENPLSTRRGRHRGCDTNFGTDWNDLVIDLTPDAPQLTPMHQVPYFKLSCANFSKQRIPPQETDFAPDELFANDDNNRKDTWEENYFYLPRYPK